MDSNTFFSLNFITYYRKRFQDWFLCKKPNCPLCGKCIKPSSLRGHIKNVTCGTLLTLTPTQRVSVIKEFNSQGCRTVSRIPHGLSVEEELAKGIIKLTKACFWKRKLFIACEFEDLTTSWVAGSTLQKSRVGRNLLKSAYRSGILR